MPDRRLSAGPGTGRVSGGPGAGRVSAGPGTGRLSGGPGTGRVSAGVRRVIRPAASRIASPAFARYWRARRHRRPRVLVYADSRATHVTGPLGKSVFGTYVSSLMRCYCVHPVVLPHSHTTLPDFLTFWSRRARGYDAVILHCGIVDFSPRPVSSIPKIAAVKGSDPAFAQLLCDNATYHAQAHGPPYRGEATTTLYSPEYLEAALLPELRAIPQLTWVTTNDFVDGWDGSYSRGRPADIGGRIAAFEARLRPALSHVVDLHEWSAAEVQRFTVDNVHFSPSGFAEVTRILRAELMERLG